MAQKSISSFFNKPVAKKPKEEAKILDEENPAKTKENADTRLSKDDSSQESTVADKEDSKENSKNGANVLKLDDEGLPPLRKTKSNPAFKRKAEETTKSPKKVAKEVKKVEENSPKKVVSGVKVSEKKAVEAEEVHEAMEVDESPVKITRKKKKAVIDSDSDEDSVVNKKSPKKENVPEPKKDSPKEKTSLKKNTSSSKIKNKLDEKDSSVQETSNGEKVTPSKEKLSPKKNTPASEKSKTKSSPKKGEQKSMSNFFTPKSTKSKSKLDNGEKADKKEEKVDKPGENVEKVEKVDKKEEKATEEAVKKEEKPKAAFASFFSPKAGGSKKNEGGSDYNKKVLQSSYHPLEDSFWAQGEPTPYLALAKTLESIEATSGRLKTIEILSNYFRSVIVQNPTDLLASVYMTLNRLAPAWEGVELGIGESLLMKAIANSTGRSAAQIKTDAQNLGDLGLVAEQSRGGQRTMFQPAHLTVQGVFNKLKDIANMTGHSAGAKKVDKVQALLVACRGSEARYLIRSLAGKLRIGLAEQSVLQALAQAVVQTPIGQEYPPENHTMFKNTEGEKFKEELSRESLKLKTSYCECPSYDLLIPALLEVGIGGLSERCKLTPGIPLKPMLAHPTKGVQEVLTRFENCKFTCEWKYDGERAQIHLHDDGKINIFSRNQEDNTTKFPDIISRLNSCLGSNVKSAVLDCEAVAWDREKKSIQPFQILSTRKRKDAVEEDIKVQVCVFAFDLLYLNGENLVTKSFEDRRNLLKEHFKAVEGEFHFAQSVDGNTTEEIQEALEESIKDNCEGLMVKTLDVDATYEIARRSHNWLKLKKDYLEGVGDTLDLVVLGGYLGKGKRAGKYGGFLLACYEPENEEYQSICKIGTGFTDEDLDKHSTFFKENLADKPKSYYSFDSSLAPDHWFEPVQVWEVKCADLSISPIHRAATGIVDPSKGVSLRFPRFIRIRDDKKVEDATNAEQIASMYSNQDVVKNQNKDKKSSPEDDFDF